MVVRHVLALAVLIACFWANAVAFGRGHVADELDAEWAVVQQTIGVGVGTADAHAVLALALQATGARVIGLAGFLNVSAHFSRTCKELRLG